MKELAMTRIQYDLLMKEIWDKHRFSRLSIKYWDDEGVTNRCKHIKYVRPNWDMRDGRCFSIMFNGMTCGVDGKEFGSGYGETVPLFDQIMGWLNSPVEVLATETTKVGHNSRTIHETEESREIEIRSKENGG